MVTNRHLEVFGRKKERACESETRVSTSRGPFVLEPTISKRLLRRLTLIQFDVYTYGRHLI